MPLGSGHDEAIVRFVDGRPSRFSALRHRKVGHPKIWWHVDYSRWFPKDGIAILPGDSFTYEFTVRNTGSNMYHSHFMAERRSPRDDACRTSGWSWLPTLDCPIVTTASKDPERDLAALRKEALGAV